MTANQTQRAVIQCGKVPQVNTWPLKSGELAVRPGCRRVYEPEAGRQIVGGFSINSQFSDDVMHYVFDVAITGPRDLRLLLLDENFATFQVLALNLDVIPRVITYAYCFTQGLICSPDMPTIFFIVGSSAEIALQPDPVEDAPFTSIPVPRGTVTSCNGRAIIASGASLFYSDTPTTQGGDLRNFVGFNTSFQPGTIYGLHEGAGGMLVICTSAGVYGLDASAFAVDLVQTNNTDWRMLNHTRFISYGSSCNVKGRIFGLTEEGWTLVDIESTQEATLSQPIMPRAIGPRIASVDFRDCLMVSTVDGPAVVDPLTRYWHRTNLADDLLSWWRPPQTDTATELPLMCGTLVEFDGTELYLFSDGVYATQNSSFDGDVELDSDFLTQAPGVLLVLLPAPPDENRLVRYVTIGAEAPLVAVAVRGKPRLSQTEPDPNGLIVGTSVWGETGLRYVTAPITSVGFEFGEADCYPSRDLSVELVALGNLTRLDPMVAVDFSKSAPLRPMKVG